MEDPYEGIEPLEITAGGQIDPEDAVGRDRQIEQLLRLVRPGANGALLLGDRRIGKSTLFNAIEGRLSDVGHRVIRVSAETASLSTFGTELGKAIRKNGRAWGLEFGAEATVNVGVGKITVTGKGARGAQTTEVDLFTLCTQDIDDGSPYLVIFLIDEITVLATSLAKTDPDAARELLRTLRRARQSSSRIIMFYAGSIGLHHAALDDTEVNDLLPQQVEVLGHEDAVLLAKRLLASVRLPVTSLDDVTVEMATLTDGFPFYIQSLALHLSTRHYDNPVSPDDVRDAMSLAMQDWHIEHYDTRITEYYGSQNAELVRAILDHIATTDHTVTTAELLVLPSIAEFNPSRTLLLDLLHRLELDHYLRREGDGDVMANDLIRHFWIYLRRLS